jgi:tetratricopeptide (TPR) repeat protein
MPVRARHAVAAAVLSLALGVSLFAVPLAPPALAMTIEAGEAVKDLPGYKTAETLIKEEKYVEAIAALNALGKPDDADVLNLLGYAHRKLGKLDEGIVFYTKALAVNPQHRGAHEYLGEAYLIKNDLKRAEELYVKLKDICGFFGCEEASELSEAIESFKKKQGS